MDCTPICMPFWQITKHRYSYLLSCVSLAICLSLVNLSFAEETNFSRDVATAIDDGIDWLDSPKCLW